jgi:hypothetical protein
MVGASIFWLNAIPSEGGISRILSAREIISCQSIDCNRRFSRGSCPTLSVGAPWSHGRWSMKLMIALVNFIVIVKVRLVIVLRKRRTDYTGPSD